MASGRNEANSSYLFKNKAEQPYKSPAGVNNEIFNTLSRNMKEQRVISATRGAMSKTIDEKDSSLTIRTKTVSQRFHISPATLLQYKPPI